MWACAWASSIRTSLVHEGLPYGESVYVDRYHHRVVLLAIVYAFEVLVRERDGWHPWSESHRVYLMYRPEVFLPGVVRASSPGEAAGYSVDNLSVTSPIGLPGGIVSSRGVGPRGLSVASVILVISAALR